MPTTNPTQNSPSSATGAQKEAINRLMEERFVPARLKRTVECVGGAYLNLLDRVQADGILRELERCPRRAPQNTYTVNPAFTFTGGATYPTSTASTFWIR